MWERAALLGLFLFCCSINGINLGVNLGRSIVGSLPRRMRVLRLYEKRVRRLTVISFDYQISQSSFLNPLVQECQSKFNRRYIFKRSRLILRISLTSIWQVRWMLYFFCLRLAAIGLRS